MKKFLKWAAIVFVGLVIITAITSGGSDTDDSADAPANGGSSADGGGEPEDCGTTATDDCTPRVDANRSVRVDALTWRVVRAQTAKALGDQEFGGGETADDQFVVVRLRVQSDRDESATLSSDIVKIETEDGRTYEPDLEGTTAALTSGEDPLFLETIGPDQSTTSTVVFDLPQSVIDERPWLRFNELGLGTTHGFIRLPRPTSR